jgi:transposase-like protein
MKEREKKIMCRFNKKREMGTCPKCGSDYNEMTDFEMDIGCLWTKWSCKDCEETWNEYYTLIYDGYTHGGKVYDADGEEC